MDLEAIRQRSAKAIDGIRGTQQKYDSPHFPIRASARDVPALLELVEAQQHTIEHEREKAKAIKEGVSALVIAAMNFVHGEGDKDALEALVEAADKMPWTVLDDLGIPRDEED